MKFIVSSKRLRFRSILEYLTSLHTSKFIFIQMDMSRRRLLNMHLLRVCS